MVFCGYFPKRIQPVPAGFDVAGIVDIASVSCCIVEGPPGWIDRWVHNGLGLFDSVELAELVVPDESRAAYDLFAYRALEQQLDGGRALQWTVPGGPGGAPGPNFESLGYDAVSRSSESFFECSPLSCNGAAKSLAKNQHCLFASLDEALRGAMAFSTGEWEPGPYHVVEVLRRRRSTGQ